MSWLGRTVSQHVGIFGLILSSALFSCEDPSELGLQLIQDDDDIAVVEAEIALSASVVLLDSINTTNRGILMTGNHIDNDFGAVQVNGFQRILAPSSDVTIPVEVTNFDSVRLDYGITYRYGEDFSTPQQLSVHQLQEEIVFDSLYFSNHNVPFEPMSLTDTTFMVSESDSLLSLNLDALGAEFLEALRAYEADSANAAEFVQQFKGVALVTDPASDAVLGVNPLATESRLNLYYTTDDTVVNTIVIRYSTYFNEIITDFTGTQLEGITTNMEFNPMDDRIYMQAGAAIVPKISMQNYFDFLDNDTTGTIVVNKAELIISDLEGLGESISPPIQFSMFFASDNNDFEFTDSDPPLPGTVQTDGIYISASRNNLDAFNLTSQSSRAQLDTTNVEYLPQITLFTQLIADGTLTRAQTEEFLLVPYSFVENAAFIRDFGRNLDRFIVQPDKVRMKIFYTRLR